MNINQSTSETPAMSRDKVIIRTSVIGIAANVLLAAFKVVLDAVNNLSDALSSIITIVGTKLAGKLPDKKHPLGYGRVEYLSAMLVSGIVLYAGITSAVESVKKIIHPEKPDYSVISLVIIAVAVFVKIVLGRYVKAQGEKVNSGSLVASGTDAMFDAILSSSVLASAIIFKVSGISLEAYVGAVISVIIIKSGVEMMMETLDQILGERAEKEITDKIIAIMKEEKDVRGAYDLVLHNYGPDHFNGSVHIEVPDTLSANDLDKLLRTITLDVYHKYRVLLTAIGVYSVNTGENEAARMRDRIYEEVRAHQYVNQVHGFYVNEEKKTIRFDVVVSFDAPDRRKVWAEVCEKVQQMYPDYTLMVAMDSDFSEE